MFVFVIYVVVTMCVAVDRHWGRSIILLTTWSCRMSL